MNGIPKDKLDEQAEFVDMMADWTYEQLAGSITGDPGIPSFQPEGICQIDPRNHERVLFSPARARRPSDNEPEDQPSAPLDPEEQVARDLARCPVCTGKTTSILDITELPSGRHTFINKNLYPVVYPGDGFAEAGDAPEIGIDGPSAMGQEARGVHLLQWFSNDHYDDIDTQDPADLKVVFGRLLMLEAKLLHGKGSKMPKTTATQGPPHNGYVGIIKNYGRLVGGSLAHGHMQIVHTNVLPRRIEDDARFHERYDVPFARHMLENNPESLTVKDFGGKIRMLIPYFMRRPLDAFFIPLGTAETHLHHLETAHIEALAEALQFATATAKAAMPQIGREPAYNIIFHTGPVGLLYVELLPYTQETGGYENMGLYMCQGSSSGTATIYRDALG